MAVAASFEEVGDLIERETEAFWAALMTRSIVTASG